MLTTEEFLGAAAEELGDNSPAPQSKPRASMLYRCARQNAYYMAGCTPSDPHQQGRLDSEITAEQGRMTEDLTVRILAKKGVIVVNRQAEMPEDFPVTGHIDGEIGTNGFESKNPGRRDFIRLIKSGGTENGIPGWLMQLVCYGTGRGWDSCSLYALAQDASSIRAEARQSLRYKSPEARWGSLQHNPKVYTEVINLVPHYKTLWPKLNKRALDLVGAGQAPETVRREFDPEAKDREGNLVFPCSHCEQYSRCLRDGEGGEVITPV